MLAPETVLQGRYRIVRQLGQGGMGAVYEAVDERLDTVVALKETLFTDEKLRKQFEREARLLARLHHQALPRVSDHFTEGDGQFLVMQYIAGDDLFEMLNQRKSPFTEGEVLRWGDQLCDALDYLHTQDPQIIHRDIKPQNLKLTARGQIVLLDFGLAKGSGGQMSVVTTSASIFGYTPNYAPLEQVQGMGTDARSDIYSLSATLYHLLTNIKPPDALTRAAAIVNGQADPLIPANELMPQVGATVAAVISKGMSQKRDDRYESATAMSESLRAAADHSSSDASTVVGARTSFSGASTLMGGKQTFQVSSPTQPIGNEARTLIAKDATNVQQASSDSAATMVRPNVASKKPRTWLIAAVLVILLGGSVGAFYVYRTRRASAQQNTVSTPPEAAPPAKSESNSDVKVNEPAAREEAKSAEAKSEKAKAEANNQRAAAKQTGEKNTETNKATNTQTSQTDVPTHERDREPNRNTNPSTENSSNDSSRNPGHPQRPNQTPGVRTFPNGMKVVTQPDGTRIITMPNGTTRVIPPNEKPNRRRP